MTARAAELLRSAADELAADGDIRAELVAIRGRLDRLEREGDTCPRLLSPGELADSMGQSRTSIHRMEHEGALPAPRAVPGLERPRFLSTDVPAHLTSLPAAPLPGPRKKHGRRS